jgi:hypothetical protein
MQRGKCIDVTPVGWEPAATSSQGMARISAIELHGGVVLGVGGAISISGA